MDELTTILRLIHSVRRCSSLPLDRSGPEIIAHVIEALDMDYDLHVSQQPAIVGLLIRSLCSEPDPGVPRDVLDAALQGGWLEGVGLPLDPSAAREHLPTQMAEGDYRSSKRRAVGAGIADVPMATEVYSSDARSTNSQHSHFYSPSASGPGSSQHGVPLGQPASPMMPVAPGSTHSSTRSIQGIPTADSYARSNALSSAPGDLSGPWVQQPLQHSAALLGSDRHQFPAAPQYARGPPVDQREPASIQVGSLARAPRSVTQAVQAGKRRQISSNALPLDEVRMFLSAAENAEREEAPSVASQDSGQGSKSIKAWSANEKGTIVSFFFSRDAPEERVKQALKTKKTAKSRTWPLHPIWDELCTVVGGTRTVDQLITAFYEIVEAFATIVQFCGFTGGGGDGDRTTEQELIAQLGRSVGKDRTKKFGKIHAWEFQEWAKDSEDGPLALMLRDHPNVIRAGNHRSGAPISPEPSPAKAKKSLPAFTLPQAARAVNETSSSSAQTPSAPRSQSSVAESSHFSFASGPLPARVTLPSVAAGFSPAYRTSSLPVDGLLPARASPAPVPPPRQPQPPNAKNTPAPMPHTHGGQGPYQAEALTRLKEKEVESRSEVDHSKAYMFRNVTELHSIAVAEEFTIKRLQLRSELVTEMGKEEGNRLPNRLDSAWRVVRELEATSEPEIQLKQKALDFLTHAMDPESPSVNWAVLVEQAKILHPLTEAPVAPSGLD